MRPDQLLYFIFKDDIEYRYKVSIPFQENLEPPLPEARNETERVYQSGSVAANQTLEVIVEGLTDAVIYTVTVWAVNVEINKTSEPVILLADVRVSGNSIENKSTELNVHS